MRFKPHARLADPLPFLTRLANVWAILRAGQQCVFLKRRPLRISQHESEAGLAFVPARASSSAASSGMVMSFFSEMRPRRKARCGSSLAWRRPPRGFGATLPAAPKALTRLIAKDGETLNRCRAPAMSSRYKSHNALTKIV